MPSPPKKSRINPRLVLVRLERVGGKKNDGYHPNGYDRADRPNDANEELHKHLYGQICGYF
jgi:hypothetical protein